MHGFYMDDGDSDPGPQVFTSALNLWCISIAPCCPHSLARFAYDQTHGHADWQEGVSGNDKARLSAL